MKGLTNEDYAYFAGLMDGEGSFMIGKHFSKTSHCGKRGWIWELKASIGMSDKQALNWILRKFNKKRLRVAVSTKSRTMYHLSFYSGELRVFLPNLIPFLKVKKQQAILLNKCINIIKPKSSSIVDKFLNKAYLRMKILNHSKFAPK
jgi:hypothetical protein